MIGRLLAWICRRGLGRREARSLAAQNALAMEMDERIDRLSGRLDAEDERLARVSALLAEQAAIARRAPSSPDGQP
ncbi:MAG: hypothetical protein U0556_09805 [Dehalococcoidia bacterium]